MMMYNFDVDNGRQQYSHLKQINMLQMGLLLLSFGFPPDSLCYCAVQVLFAPGYRTTIIFEHSFLCLFKNV